MSVCMSEVSLAPPVGTCEPSLAYRKHLYLHKLLVTMMMTLLTALLYARNRAHQDFTVICSNIGGITCSHRKYDRHKNRHMSAWSHPGTLHQQLEACLAHLVYSPMPMLQPFAYRQLTCRLQTCLSSAYRQLTCWLKLCSAETLHEPIHCE